MAKEKFNVASRNDGRLYRAIVCRDREAVLEELNAADIDPDLTVHGKSLLQHAGERGFKDIAWLLIDYGADVNWRYGKQNRSLLHFAVATGNYGFASLLLECGANPSPRTANQSTPLHFAARANQEYMVNALIRYKADISAEDSAGRTAADLALRNCHAELARKLINGTCCSSGRLKTILAGEAATVAVPRIIEFTG